MNILPINEILPELKNVLNSQNAVLVAPPGSGKTTRIPLALMDEPWLRGQKIIMLEPRRLAARAAARYMAQQLGEQVGEKVGYRVRFDTCISSQTRIEVVTEGILTRMLQTDQALNGIGLVIFDEFHERNIHADLGLVLALETQSFLREDLRLLVMSATLSAEPVAELLGNAPVIGSKGQTFPVETHYLERRTAENTETIVVETIFHALANHAGDILVFLPGAGEIRRVQARLVEKGIAGFAHIAPLYAALPANVQDEAILPNVTGVRKVVLATSIAETSLTVEGIRVVIDSGLMRVPHYLFRTGLTSLETVRVTKSAADQRRGRAGRLGPGICYRLWTKQEHYYLEPDTAPEILSADLTPLALELAAWGIADPSEVHWLDQPPARTFSQARELLGKLEALDSNGLITGHGRQILRTGLQPRLAHMVLRAMELGLGAVACELAAILSERDFLQAVDVDLRLRLAVLRQLNPKDNQVWPPGQQLDISLCRRICREAERLKREFGNVPGQPNDIEWCGCLLAFAYPDRIGQRRSNGKFLLENGRGAVLVGDQPLARANYIVAPNLDGQGSESRIFLAVPIELEQLTDYFKRQIFTEATVFWDETAQSVRSRVYERLGALIIKEKPCLAPAPAAVLSALFSGIVREGLAILPWSRAARQLRQRLLFMHYWEQGWPDVTDEVLLGTLDTWLGPFAYGLTSRNELEQLNLVTILESMLSWEQRQELERYAPTHFIVPSGQRLPIDYSNPDCPVLAVKLQEMFGLQATPCIARGKVPLTLHLLSPARRPVQVTQDLASFWRTTYFEVKKDLMGRYPKHYWPEDPLVAIPTSRVRPQG
ncbi:ATP-dependent helicase HrpB [Sporomusa acidovorans]|uniref:ATP-dependent RNA helicase HrpB n=1 Tax=Sporomusa acidovorans (strain ATCC 49682 / DSM 3132 / Mol) TaxID=1123286 RepID=A0ABZ3J0T2_SPOA4|nr:ATP-dependent helicase HrpB [Sporomusa acidovorans]OZC22851.1 ATP-dependent RNA helicase HrpB [Sporomusa acidovorans DSM 3132]SDE52961.1 ATP-dependent helicase HrpB [Sporomusa acidovorans]